jgi:transposase InsO family protein
MTITGKLEPIDAGLLEAAWRHQLIAPLLRGSDKSKRQYKAQITSEPVDHPWRGKVSVSCRSLRRWARLFREGGGLEKLVKKARQDKGKSKALPPGALERAIELREEDGRRSVPMLLTLLANEKKDWAGLARSTLDRHLRANGSVRRPRGPQGPYHSFEASGPMDLWQGDILHGPVVLFEGKPRRCRIVAWIDDYSRYVCQLKAYPDETLPSIEDSLKHAVLAHGVPTRLFVDNAWVYSGKAFTLACSELGIAKCHSTPRYPASRGKMERFFRTLREQLIQEVENLETITADELNTYLLAWLDGYHRRKHSGTEQTPAERFAGRPVRPVASTQHLESAFWQWDTRTVSSIGEIKFGGNTYRVDSSFAKQKVVIRYDPFDLSRLYIWRDGRRVATATTERLIHERRRGKPTPQRTRGSAAAQAYLEKLVQAHDDRLDRECNLTSFPDTNTDKESNQ